MPARSAARFRLHPSDDRRASRLGRSTPGSQTDAALPKVRLVATGGTISNRNGGRLTAEELIKSMPGIERYARPESEQFANISSSALTLQQWLDLARRINALFAEDADLAGIVVTSGTDTLEETAYFLNLTVRSDKPVVVVGSMRNPSTLGYEGAANLLEGFRVAADPQSRGKGVLVVLNDEINAARDVTKTDALRLQTFQTARVRRARRRRRRSCRLLPRRGQAAHEEQRVRRRQDRRAPARGRRPGLPGRDRRHHQGASSIRAPRGSSSRRPAPARRAARRATASDTRSRRACSWSPARGPAAAASPRARALRLRQRTGIDRGHPCCALPPRISRRSRPASS